MPSYARLRSTVLVLVGALLAGCGGGSIVIVPVEILERPPVADAGLDRVARVNTLVTLDGSLSSDPEGSALTFHWVQTEGPFVALTDATGAKPTFRPAVPGTYVFSLEVDDGSGGAASAPQAVTLIVIDDLAAQPRRAPAAVPRAAELRHAAFLASPPSANPSGVLLADGSQRNVQVVDVAADPSDDPAAATLVGLLKVHVVVGAALFARVYAQLQPGDEDPVQLLGPGGSQDEVVSYGVAGEAFVLDATRSHDDGVVQTFTWSQVGGPFKFTTEDSLISVVPLAGTYVFDLVVTDDIGLSSFTQRVVIPVVPAGLPGAGPPTARAVFTSGTVVVGTDDTPTVAIAGTPVVLSGASSTSRNGGALTFTWEQVGGPTAVVTGATTATLQMVGQAPGAYAFELTVTDANGVSHARVTELTVAAAGSAAPTPALVPIPDQVLVPGGIPPLVVVLDGTPSSGAGPLTFRFEQTAGMPVFIENAATGLGTIVPPHAGVYEFELSVFDGTSLSAPVRRSFRVR